MQQTQTLDTLPTQAIDHSFLDEFGTLCDAPDWLSGPTPAELEEARIAAQEAETRRELLETQFVESLKKPSLYTHPDTGVSQIVYGTTLPGERILFPEYFAGDLMSVEARALKRHPEDFGFVTRGHKCTRLDNTPVSLLQRAGLLEQPHDAPLHPLTSDEEAALEDM